MTFALALYTLFGHAFLWIGLVNRLHAIAFPRWIIDLLTAVIFSVIGAGPVVVLAWWLAGWESPFARLDASLAQHPGRMFLAIYCGICWLAGTGTLLRWLWHKLYFRRPSKLLRIDQRHRAAISLEQAALHPEEGVHHFTVNLPGNQTLQLDVTRRTFDVPRLPPALNGLKILHLSDFHFTGNVGKAYFREVVRIGNELQPDLIALTGDYADSDACIDWIPDTLGRLAAPCGVYFVLGNHDTFINTCRLREVLRASGPIDLGGRWLQVPIRGESIIVAGNELPWIAPAAELSRCGPSSAQGGPVRIVLSHSPDQIDWARFHEVDLMLCGHTHGGQIRLPLVGAILMPSYYGVKFDCGLFHLPPTVLHVTRGISGKQSLRWNCAPEIVLLTLHALRK
jgi:uncharacterized protein